MRAYLLAAGCGTRLRPLTDRVPKCLVQINGRPLLSYWFELLEKHSVDSVCINTHHLHQQVVDYVKGVKTPLDITMSYEPRLLGSAGTLRANRKFSDKEEEFFVLYADNLTNADLSALLKTHRLSGLPVTLGLFRSLSPWLCGITVQDDRGIIVDFEEKPAHPKSKMAFSGLMVGGPELIRAIPEKIPCDLGRDVFPGLVGKMAGWEMKGYLRDIGTPESYEMAVAESKTIWGELS